MFLGDLFGLSLYTFAVNPPLPVVLFGHLEESQALMDEAEY